MPAIKTINEKIANTNEIVLKVEFFLQTDVFISKKIPIKIFKKLHSKTAKSK
jgi:hypothetical protein